MIFSARGVGGGELRLLDGRLDLHPRSSPVRVTSSRNASADVVGLVGDAGLGRDDLRLAVDQRDGGVDRLRPSSLMPASTSPSAPSRRGRAPARRPRRFMRQRRRRSRCGLQLHRRVAEDQRHRAGHRRVGERRPAPAARRPRRCRARRDDGRQLDRRVARRQVDVRRRVGVAASGSKPSPGAGSSATTSPTSEARRRRRSAAVPTSSASAVEGRVERGVVDVDDGVEVVAAGAVVPQPAGSQLLPPPASATEAA